ncbi:MAG: hypothetical protein M0Q91_02090 [Methanoregula sp.]|nr:hypothetical protein [Methanoregula sp.]
MQDDILVSSRCNPEDRDITFHVGKVKVNPPLPETILLNDGCHYAVAAMPTMTLPPTMNFRSGKEAVYTGECFVGRIDSPRIGSEVSLQVIRSRIT